MDDALANIDDYNKKIKQKVLIVDDDNNGDDDNNRDDNRDDDRDKNNGNDKIAETDSIDLSWMNNLQLYRQIVPEVFAIYDSDKDSFELFTLRIFIDNINNERVKNKKRCTRRI